MSPAHLTQTNLPSTLDAVNAFAVSQWMHLPQPLRRNFWSLYPFALLGKGNLRLTLFFDFCFQNSLLILLPEHISSLNILWIDNMIFSFSFFSRAQWVKGIAYHRTSKILAKLLFLVVPKTVPLTSPWLRCGRQRPQGASKGCSLYHAQLKQGRQEIHHEQGIAPFCLHHVMPGESINCVFG